MNRLYGIITHVQQSGSIVLADIDVDGYQFSSLLVSANEGSVWLHEGGKVLVIFKETEVSLGKDITGTLSLRNSVPCIVNAVHHGEILSMVLLSFAGHTIKSAITSRSSDILNIQPGDHVTAYIKANEVTLTESTS